ncbi:DASS family sodium-coupled anion symporter [Egicoccus sp. AB-alg2]|uniref:SLC13 family permease n=1 Tax=Egicoccus sp. AB-alg2 TaxID=3242693 RepID=UPI00359EE679
MGELTEPRRITRRAVIGRWAGPVAALATYFLLPTGDGGLTPGGRATTAVAVLMAVWWVTEALPLAVTALVPVVLMPLTGALDLDATLAPYANDLIFLFLGGFVIAIAMQRWGLHRRIALLTVRAVGTKSRQMIAGFMLATAFLSMWVSNTATAVMMLPIGVSVLGLVAKRVSSIPGDGEGEPLTGEGAPNIATALMLGIAYAASIGSLSTIIGTPPNAFLIGYLRQEQGVSIGFGQWMLFALPLSAVFLVITWIVLTRFLYPPEIDDVPGGRELIQSELDELGPISPGEKRVAVVFAATALAWILNSLLGDVWADTFLANLDDAMIGIAAAIILFLIPVDREHGTFVLDWTAARELPWGVLLLFGGGLSLAAAVSENGVDEFVGQQLQALSNVPVWVLIAAVVASVILLTEMTSNTATAAALVPIIGGSAAVLGLDPVALAVPAALAATCAFALPVATPPNAIVFGSGHVTVAQMARAGVVLNVIGVLLITIVTLTLAGPVFGTG